jgi:hypothetical protein
MEYATALSSNTSVASWRDYTGMDISPGKSDAGSADERSRKSVPAEEDTRFQRNKSHHL